MKKGIKWFAIASVVLGTAALATDSAPSGFQSDLDSGDIVSGVHKTQAVAAARAEWRCQPNNSACSKSSGSIYFNKQVKINGGANISIAQFLNIKGSGNTGSSEPISQLVVDEQSNGTYRVSIEQNNYNCGFRVPKGVWMPIEGGIDQGGVGWFKINGQFCQRPAGSPARSAGYPAADSYSGVNTYYFKYGAYNAESNTVASSVSWR